MNKLVFYLIFAIQLLSSDMENLTHILLLLM